MNSVKSVVIIVALTFAAALTLAQDRSQAQQFQEAIHLMETKGNYTAAIRLFEEAAKGSDRTLAARSLYYVGQCYEKLGKDKAQKAYQRLIKQFADQGQVVAQARARLTALSPHAGASASAAKAATGVVVRQVWAGPTTDPLGGVSADGKYLSHVDWETGDLAVRELATEKKRRLTNKGTWFESTEFALFSIISPDSKQVAYAWFNKDLTWDLRVVGLDGSAARVIYRNDEVDYVQPHAWSPDGKNILTSFARRDRTNQVGWVSVADGSAQILKTLGQRDVTKMSLSPDGRYIAYDFLTQQDPPTRDIFLLTADGKREIPLVKHPANDLYPVWTPDGRSVLFASDRTGTLGAWIIQVADGKPLGQPELVKPDMGRMFPIGFTRNGSFFYGLEASSNDIYTAEVDFATGKLLSQPTTATQRFVGSNSRAVWSADGKYLAYTSQRGPIAGDFGKVLVIRFLDTGKERELLVDMRNFNPAGWSPDGRFVLVTGRDKNNLQGIHKIDAQTGDAATLVPSEPGADIQWPAWPSDFKQIYYLRRDPSDRKITRLITRDLNSGREKEIYRAVVPVFISGISLSPDGKLLALRWNDDSKKGTAIMIMPSESGELRELLRVPETENLPGNTPILFTPDARYLLYTKGGTKPEDQKFDLWRVPIEGGPPKKTELSMNNLRFLRLHPDGRRLAFTAGQYKAEVWVMENFLPSAQTKKTTASRRQLHILKQ